MALDTYSKLVGKVLLRCPSADQLLARDWINNAFRRVAERRSWSWLIKRDQFLAVDAYSTGTASVTHNSTAIVGTGTTFTAAMVGRQFRISGSPIYTVATYTDGTHITLDDEYGGDTDGTASYQIFKCWYAVPTDFHSFRSLWNTESPLHIPTVVTQRELNNWDPSRDNQGDPYCAAFYDYYVPSGETVAVPRYELWPNPIAQAVYPYLYEARPTDLEDSGATLPRFLHGDILVEMALEMAALWPGPAVEKPNPYFNRDLAKHHRAEAERLLLEFERQDEEVDIQNLYYTTDGGGFDDAYRQSHDI